MILLYKRETWDTLKRAAIIRKHDISNIEVDNELQFPHIYYHRKCYQYSTMKSSLIKIDSEHTRQSELLNARLTKIDSFETVEEGYRPKRKEWKNSNNSALLPKRCLFCKKNKYKDRHLERLIQCVEDRAVESIKRAATLANDFHMISLSSKDLIAAEAFYHGSCYKSYVKGKQTKANVIPNEEDVRYKNAELSAFKEVVTVCHALTMNPRVISFVSLLKRMEEMLSDNHHKIRDSTRNYLRRNLEKHLEDINFINVNGHLYVYATSLSLEDLIPEYINLSNEIDKITKDFEELSHMNNVGKSGKQIRKDIMDLQDNLPWPPQSHDLTPEKFQIPQSLDLLLKTVMSSRPARLRFSIAQDIIYTTTEGRIKTPKSILLPTMVKTLTNSTELINILNRLGHGVSYSLLMEAQTENAFQILEQQIESGCIIPKDCQKEKFTIFVADNIDRQKETLSGIQCFTFFETLVDRMFVYPTVLSSIRKIKKTKTVYIYTWKCEFYLSVHQFARRGKHMNILVLIFCL